MGEVRAEPFQGLTEYWGNPPFSRNQENSVTLTTTPPQFSIPALLGPLPRVLGTGQCEHQGQTPWRREVLLVVP